MPFLQLKICNLPLLQWVSSQLFICFTSRFSMKKFINNIWTAKIHVIVTEIFFSPRRSGAFQMKKSPDLSRCLCFILFKISIRNFERVVNFSICRMLTLQASVLGSHPYSETGYPEGQEEFFWHVLFFILFMKIFLEGLSYIMFKWKYE